MSAGNQPHGRMPASSRITPHAEHERAEGLGEARADLRLLVGRGSQLEQATDGRPRSAEEEPAGAERGAHHQGQPDQGGHDRQVEEDRGEKDDRGAPCAEALAARIDETDGDGHEVSWWHVA